MSRSDAARYVAAETAVSVAINAALNVLPAVLPAGGGQGTPGNTHGLAAALPLFMGAFMSALVPSLLTRWRQHAGKHQALLGGDRPAAIQVAAVSLLLAALSTLGMLLAGAVPLTGEGLASGATLLGKGAQGGLVALLVTPSALLLLFGRGWRKSHGQDKHAPAARSC